MDFQDYVRTNILQPLGMRNSNYLSEVSAPGKVALPGLPGYLLAKGALVESVPFDATTGDTLGTMFLEIPLGFGRDLSLIDSGGAATTTSQAPDGAYLAVFGPAGSAATVVVE